MLVIDHPDADRRINKRRVVIDQKGKYSSYVIVQGDPQLKFMRWLVMNELIKEVPDEPRPEDMATTSAGAK